MNIDASKVIAIPAATLNTTIQQSSNFVTIGGFATTDTMPADLNGTLSSIKIGFKLANVSVPNSSILGTLAEGTPYTIALADEAFVDIYGNRNNAFSATYETKPRPTVVSIKRVGSDGKPLTDDTQEPRYTNASVIYFAVQLTDGIPDDGTSNNLFVIPGGVTTGSFAVIPYGTDSLFLTYTPSTVNTPPTVSPVFTESDGVNAKITGLASPAGTNRIN